jgi:tripartite motif-containing protein 56
MLTMPSCCRVHKGEVIKFYCETCNSALCLPCTFLEHKGHEVEEIKAVREHFSHDINDLVNRVSMPRILYIVSTY